MCSSDLLAKLHHWELITIDGNLLKEGEIGGLPTVETYAGVDDKAMGYKTTVYAVHTKLRAIDEAAHRGREVLLFIDELNRCDHAVQQELMNLILNREINGYHLPKSVKIIAAMNPSEQYGGSLDYQVVDMDGAQANRFVWLTMESDPMQWLGWAAEAGIEEKVRDFIATFPEYLYKKGEDLVATPRSYERVSKSYALYQSDGQKYSRRVFLNVIAGNIGRVLAEAFVSFVEANHQPLLTYEEVFGPSSLEAGVKARIQQESHTRLYLTANNLLNQLNHEIQQGQVLSEEVVLRLIAFLNLYPLDLKIGIMKDIKQSYGMIYEVAIEQEAFVNAYFEAYRQIRGE